MYDLLYGPSLAVSEHDGIKEFIIIRSTKYLDLDSNPKC